MLLNSGKNGLPGSYRTPHSFSSPFPLLTLQHPVASFLPQWTNNFAHATCHTKTKKQHWNNYTSGAWTQCSAAPLFLIPLALCVSACVHVCVWNVVLFTQVRKCGNPQEQLPRGSLIAPTTSRPKQFISNWQNKRQTQSRSVQPQAVGVLISPLNPLKASEILFKDVFKSLREV